MTATRARALLDSLLDMIDTRPLTHTTGALARDSNSHQVPALSPAACCWCVRGMLLKLRGVPSLDHPDVFPATQLLLIAANELGYQSTSACNDALRRDGAVRMARRALQLLDEFDLASLLASAPDLPAQARDLQTSGSST